MKNPGIKTRVVHSETKSNYNVICLKLGKKYKICRVPYLVSDNEQLTEIERKEALEHAEFISFCFNNSDLILNEKI